MNDLIDKETKQFLLVLAGILIYILFIYPRMAGGPIGNPAQGVNGLFGTATTRTSSTARSTVKFDKTKNYFAVVNTSEGEFTLDLLEKSAPNNVASFISQAERYKSANFAVERNFLLRADSSRDVSTTIADEINVDVLGLSDTKVRDVSYFSRMYDPANPSTRYFSPENLEKYGDFTVKEFYEEILDYKYTPGLETPSAKKYIGYMTSTGPNTNKTDFFILMTDAAANVNGRYTPIAQVTEGFTVLDTINESRSGSVTINSISIITR